MRIAVFDVSEKNIKTIREWIIAYFREYQTEFDVLWVSKYVMKDTLRKYAYEIHIAYISLDSPQGLALGKELYALNPECRICYYRSEPCNLHPLLCTRPIDFFCMDDGEAKFLQVHHSRIEEVVNAGCVVTIDTRKQGYCFTSGEIEYIQSSLKYIDIFVRHGEPVHIFYKLSDIEQKLDFRFLRIHKSYIVNSVYVARIDKESHTVLMRSGVSLPVSNPYYKNVLLRFGLS